MTIAETENRVLGGWRGFLRSELEQPYMQELVSFLKKEHSAGKKILPPKEKVLRALGTVDLCDVRVVILGQDPYHGIGQANGLSFAVSDGVTRPPSLRNIFKELGTDLGSGCAAENSFDQTLESWAHQGVLLLNSVLTVEQDKPFSHREKGWEQFTAAVVDLVNETCKNVVFILWGSAAGRHKLRIDVNKHLIITSAHPSPLSAHRGFFGSRPFSKANDYLLKHGKLPVQWLT